MKTLSIRELARKTGYSTATVSKALRNLPEIRTATRLAIRKTAKQMGYLRNARIAEVMREIRTPTTSRKYHALACLIWSLDPQWLARPSIAIMHAAAQACARTLGWELQTFSLNDPALPRRSLGRILHNRGIKGSIILPIDTTVEDLEIDYSRLAAVTIGYTVSRPVLCRVGRASLDSMEIIFQELRRRGYKRPGLAVDHKEILRTHRHPWAGFVTMQQELPAKDRLPILIWNHFDKETFFRWIKRHQPDVVIGGNRYVLNVLRKAAYKVPDQLGFVLFTRLDNDENIAGLDPNYKLLAEGAVNLAIQMASQAKFGVPETPQNLLVTGSWKDGGTLRKPLPFSPAYNRPLPI